MASCSQSTYSRATAHCRCHCLLVATLGGEESRAVAGVKGSLGLSTPWTIVVTWEMLARRVSPRLGPSVVAWCQPFWHAVAAPSASADRIQ